MGCCTTSVSTTQKTARLEKCTIWKIIFYNNLGTVSYIIRVYPNNRIVMRPSEKFEAKAAGQKGSEA